MTPQVRLELDRLLCALLDESLTESEHGRLEAMLAADAASRLHYLEYVDLPARLLIPPGLTGNAPLTLPDFLTPVPNHEAPRPPPPVGRRRQLWRAAGYIAVVAVTLAVSFLLQ